MSRIHVCPACNAAKNGVKSRVAFEHVGCEFDTTGTTMGDIYGDLLPSEKRRVPVYRKGQEVLVTGDNMGYFHGAGGGRKVKIMRSYTVNNGIEYEVMDTNGDFFHIHENDLS